MTLPITIKDEEKVEDLSRRGNLEGSSLLSSKFLLLKQLESKISIFIEFLKIFY
jgi:hypothetical protein